MSLKLIPPAVKVNFQQNDIYMMELYFSGISQLILVGDSIPEIPAQCFFLEVKQKHVLTVTSELTGRVKTALSPSYIAI